MYYVIARIGFGKLVSTDYADEMSTFLLDVQESNACDKTIYR
jgi:hypothetical protein